MYLLMAWNRDLKEFMLWDNNQDLAILQRNQELAEKTLFLEPNDFRYYYVEENKGVN